ncbi:MTH1187 family thiamine-binding protein [Candidatus Eisenbacteria bacterium]|uniref:MTH1187 family thiamine-binding protein n=1 Tax=Eiseniibacteriota bacterium TaxID=2212470 RepID=A0ABV6YQS2_UNCEI
MAVAEISVVPVGTDTASISSFVAAAVKTVEASGLKYELSSMATNLEGDLDSILEVFRKVHESAFEHGAVRVLTALKIDDRRDKALTIEGKKAAVRAKLN